MDRREALYELQKVDFAILELNLYLDTHPGDVQAIQQYNTLAQQKHQLRMNYEAEFGPLYNYGNSYNTYPNGWNEGPWPWEV
jgi:spore coat protein JB